VPARVDRLFRTAALTRSDAGAARMVLASSCLEYPRTHKADRPERLIVRVPQVGSGICSSISWFRCVAIGVRLRRFAVDRTAPAERAVLGSTNVECVSIRCVAATSSIGLAVRQRKVARARSKGWLALASRLCSGLSHVVAKFHGPAPFRVILGVPPTLERPSLPARKQNDQSEILGSRPDVLPCQAVVLDTEARDRRRTSRLEIVGRGDRPAVRVPHLHIDPARRRVNEDVLADGGSGTGELEPGRATIGVADVPLDPRAAQAWKDSRPGDWGSQGGVMDGSVVVIVQRRGPRRGSTL
jgi:hypothetical protein